MGKQHPISVRLLVVACLAATAAVRGAGSPTTERVNVTPAGQQATGRCWSPFMSGDGRYVLFSTTAANLLPGGGASYWGGVVLHDRSTGMNELLSVNSDGRPANGPSDMGWMTGDGRYVVFGSFGDNLVADDMNWTSDVFVRDRLLGLTEMASISSEGEQIDSEHDAPVISQDGRVVAFASPARSLVLGHTDDFWDVFVRERIMGVTLCISVGPGGEPGNADSGAQERPAISTDGRSVAFSSLASNLVPDDTNNVSDIFVRDLLTATTERISVDSLGQQADGGSSSPSMSGDGRYVVFASEATNLVSNDTNGLADVFVRDRVLGLTERVSVGPGDVQADLPCFAPAISADGRFVAFVSAATNLVPDDTNGTEDVFVYDRMTGVTERVSVSTDGQQANGRSYAVSLSASGRYVGFASAASNLVPDDTNNEDDIFVRDRGSAAGGADHDDDGDVDLTDFTFFQFCFNGPNRAADKPGCAAVDFDADGDADLADFSEFQKCFNGPNRPPACD